MDGFLYGTSMVISAFSSIAGNPACNASRDFPCVTWQSWMISSATTDEVTQLEQVCSHPEVSVILVDFTF